MVKCYREREINKLNEGAGNKLLQSRTPKHLWDDCLELEVYNRSNTVHDIDEEDGEVPKTMMFGETSDISLFCK